MQRTRSWLKSIFITGYKPTQEDFTDVFDSFVSKADEQILTNEYSGKIYISDQTRISLTPQLPIGTNYIILRNCYDSEGDVGYTLSNEDHTGFTVKVAAPATFVYKVIKL